MLYATRTEGPVTAVTAFAESGSDLAPLGIIGYGEARCRPGDFNVSATGRLIALGRAIQAFGAGVEQVGLNESVSQEDVDRVLNALILTAAQ